MNDNTPFAAQLAAVSVALNPGPLQSSPGRPLLPVRVERITDGRVLVSTYFESRSPFKHHDWAVSRIAEEFECSVDDVTVLETDDGDVLAVKGCPMFRIVC